MWMNMILRFVGGRSQKTSLDGDYNNEGFDYSGGWQERLMA